MSAAQDELEATKEVVEELSTIIAEQRRRIRTIEDALTKIAAGEIDEGGNIRPCTDAMRIAHDALHPNG